MERIQAFKFELRPTGRQTQEMRRFAGACRFVYNKALALQRQNYAAGGKYISYPAMCLLLTQWRHDPSTNWLANSPVHTLQQALKNLDAAYRNFFAKRAGYPMWKRKGRSVASFRYPAPKQFEVDSGNGRIRLPKLGWVRYRSSRPVEGTPRNVTVSEVNRKFHVSIQTQREIEQPALTSTSTIGIDMGIARFATFSDGTFVEPVSSFKRHMARLGRASRRMARKVKFSQNWKKAKGKVRKIHIKIGDVRRDFLHKTSTTISKNHAVVVIEDLQVGNMSKSAAGTVEAPGRRVAQKSGLNRSILDQGWGEFRRQLTYKMEWAGGKLIAVPAQYTSQICPSCKSVDKANRQTQALFKCVVCGYENNADVVGAMNILERGQRLSACGEIGSGRGCKTSAKPASVKQEPTEETTPCEVACSAR